MPKQYKSGDVSCLQSNNNNKKTYDCILCLKLEMNDRYFRVFDNNFHRYRFEMGVERDSARIHIDPYRFELVIDFFSSQFEEKFETTYADLEKGK